ncbi:hypothetical protein MF672_033680 [Actinomadura sp. ATCC 31491]|uniref:Integral membrane protein n=1 Tax=Actinomadura luzonensis TaxID=2805427 RepID=A0ABT0G274_9ACTN|nr:hypothetical protein [Actinomadura luzonensis]MCK2218711.1 hypothetical protein [Actinomadura luzonensis]
MSALPKARQGGFVTFVRAAIILQTATILVQAISAGLLLTTPAGETLHGIGARVVFAAALLHLAAAVLVWRPGGGSPRPAWYALGFLLLTSAQVALGIARVPALHVPLGVLMFGVSLAQLVTARTAQPQHR